MGDTPERINGSVYRSPLQQGSPSVRAARASHGCTDGDRMAAGSGWLVPKWGETLCLLSPRIRGKGGGGALAHL